MAKKTTRKLGLKKETLRRLDDSHLRKIVGGGLSGPYCTVGEASTRCGTVTDGCYTTIRTIGGGEEEGGG
jgi:hypothetical protein